jgi:hypothetical protein
MYKYPPKVRIAHAAMMNAAGENPLRCGESFVGEFAAIEMPSSSVNPLVISLLYLNEKYYTLDITHHENRFPYPPSHLHAIGLAV